MKPTERQVSIIGFDVDVGSYDYGAYLYPSFNGNVEFPATKKGFKALYHYLRTVRWMDEMMADMKKVMVSL